VVEERAEGIVEDYVRRLREARSPLLAEAGARRQLKEQARRVLEETAMVLRGSDPSRATAQGDCLSEAIGEARAAKGVHPSESLRAVAALSEAALGAVAENLPPSPTSRTEVAGVALAIQRSVTERVMRASVAYADYLLGEVHEAHRDERLRIARRLRNEAAHDLAVVFRSLELCELYLEDRDPGRAREKLRLAARTAREALGRVKELSGELEETADCEGGLEAALSGLLRSVAPPRVRTWLSVEGDASLLPPYAREELFLILREAVRLACARQETREVRVRLRVGPGAVAAAVEDDGGGAEGPSPAALEPMRERARLLRGEVRAQGGPGGVNRTEVVLPLARRGEARAAGAFPAADSRPLRVLLADPHGLFRGSLREALEAGAEGLEVVGEAADAPEASALARERRPDAVLVDLELPPAGAGEAIGAISEASPSSRVVVLGLREDPGLAGELLGAGAAGYAVKDASREDLVSAVRAAVLGGRGVVLSVPSGRPEGGRRALEGRLSERQLEVLSLVARGMSNRRIAEALGISESTVKRHLANVYSELGVGSRREAVEGLLAAGLLGP
jgi:DNA-binding NarL/FixJ family response regulator/signal transduction histidine kinase